MTHESVSMRPSRRSALTMLVSSTAALALAAPAAAAVDPIFAAIERHRAAWLEWDAAVDDLVKREDGLPKEFWGKAWTPVPEVTTTENGTLMLTMQDGAEKVFRPLTSDDSLENIGKAHCYRAYSNKDIERYVSGLGASTERARQVARRYLRSAKRRSRAAKKAAGIPAAQRRRDEAGRAERDALHDLAMTAPTSAEGVQAVITYWCEHWKTNLSEVLDEGDHRELLHLLTSLHTAVGTITAATSNIA